MVFVSFEVNDEHFAKLVQLKNALGVESIEDVFNHGLTMTDWMVKEKAKGRSIVSFDLNNKFAKVFSFEK